MSPSDSSGHWENLPDYIISITREIWEGRGVSTLNHYYSDDVLVRSPMGIQIGNQSVIASTLATIAEFPDRELFAEDVIWSGDSDTGFLSSHRVITTATHGNSGAFGSATGKRFTIRVIADCAVKDDVIYDEWLVRDYGGIVRQLGMQPCEFAARLITQEGGPGNCMHPLTPASDVQGRYSGTGNQNEWGIRYADILQQLMTAEFSIVPQVYDRAVMCEYAGSQSGLSFATVDAFWLGLRSSFPDATFTIHHQIGMDGDKLSPRAAIRWSLDGVHSGWGTFGQPTGANVHIMGICHAEFGPFGANLQGIRREYVLYDEIAVWKQILIHQSGAA